MRIENSTCSIVTLIICLGAFTTLLSCGKKTGRSQPEKHQSENVIADATPTKPIASISSPTPPIVSQEPVPENNAKKDKDAPEVEVDLVVETLENLRSTKPAKDKTVRALGYHVKGDGGGGVFYWDEEQSKDAANGGTIVDPSVELLAQGTEKGFGCWMRLDKDMTARKWGMKLNGMDDDSPRLQQVIDLLTKNDVGKPVSIIRFERTDILRLNSTVRVVHTILEGTHVPGQNRMGGSQIHVYAGKNKDSKLDAAIVMRVLSGIKGFKVVYPEQAKITATEPVKYSWFITTAKEATKDLNNTDGIVLKDLHLLNPYRGIDLTNAAQYEVENVHGQPLYQGLLVDEMLDVSRIRNVHFWTYYAGPGSNLWKWVYANATAYTFGRGDHLIGDGLFAWGYKTCFHFTEFKMSSMWGEFNNLAADKCGKALVIDSANTLSFTNGVFVTTESNYAVEISGIVKRNINFVSGMFYGTRSGRAIRINSTGGEIKFQASKLTGTQPNDFKFGATVETLSTPVFFTDTLNFAPPSEDEKYPTQHQITGASNVSINGVSMPKLGDAVFELNKAAYDASSSGCRTADPGLVAFDKSSMTLIARSQELKICAIEFALPELNTANGGLYLEAIVSQTGAFPDRTRLRAYVMSSDEKDVRTLLKLDGVPEASPSKLFLPLLVNEQSLSNRKLRIEWHAFNGADSKMIFQDVKLRSFREPPNPQFKYTFRNP